MIAQALSAPAVPVEQPRPTAQNVPRAKILIVDDDERTTLAVSTVLQELNQDIVIAHSGKEALRCLLYDDFAVILLDLQMPGMDGYETASLIRARKRTRHIPIVFLTAVFHDDSHMLQAYSAGAVDLVYKPVESFILKSKVSVFVDLYLKQVEVKHEAELRHQLQEEKLTTEEALRRSEENYRILIHGIRDYAIFMLDKDGRVVSWNIAAEQIKKYSAEEIIGKHFSEFYTVEDRQRGEPRRALETALDKGRYEADGWRLRKDGTLFWANVVIDAIYDDDGGLLGFAKITRDITERKEAQRALETAREQLMKVQKMEAVGQLTGGIAHDFNNLLTVILGNIDLLGRQSSGDERFERKLSAMRHAVERGRNLTSQLLAFSRRQRLTPETIDVNKLVHGFEPLMRRALGESVTLEIGLSEAPAICDVDPAQLETALLNLAVNARDAMPEGGVFSLDVKQIEHQPEFVAGDENPSGPMVVIAVKDTGMGMPEEVLSHAFEPFFTTKEIGKGSGLGLSQVYGFVHQTGGFVSLTSKVGEGTQVSIALPASTKQLPESSPVQADRSSAAANSERVLLVEDNAAVLTLMTEMLVDLGYRVVTASDATGALEILRRGEQIDLIFTDVVMPGQKNGVQLAAEARELRPGLKVLLMSGHTGEALKRYQMELADLPIIAKPFDQPVLAAQLRKILENTNG